MSVERKKEQQDRDALILEYEEVETLVEILKNAQGRNAQVDDLYEKWRKRWEALFLPAGRAILEQTREALDEHPPTHGSVPRGRYLENLIGELQHSCPAAVHVALLIAIDRHAQGLDS